MTERIRAMPPRGAVLLAICSVACAAALGAPAQAQAEGAAALTRPQASGGTAAQQRQAGGTAQQRQAGATALPDDPATVGGRQLAGTGVIVNYPSPFAERLPDVPASAYVIADAGTGQVLAAKDPHGMFRPASTLKVLAAIALIPVLNPDSTVVASQQAANVTPNIVGLVPGQRYKISDLFNALLLISANDAAIALAQATGSLSKGIALMNAEAHHLQAYDVQAEDPSGLDAAGQHASAYDEALIARRALAMPAFMTYDSTLEARFPVTSRTWVSLYNQNGLLTQYHGGIGGKIGWTSAAGATYIGLARRNGVTLIVTLLHCTPLTEIIYASRLLDWGFAMDGKVKPVGTLVSPLPASSPASSVKTKPMPSRRPGASGAVAGKGLPSGLASASGSLVMFAAAATTILILLRRRSPG